MLSWRNKRTFPQQHRRGETEGKQVRHSLEEVGIDDGLVESVDQCCEFWRLSQILKIGVCADLAILLKSS